MQIPCAQCNQKGHYWDICSDLSDRESGGTSKNANMHTNIAIKDNNSTNNNS